MAVAISMINRKDKRPKVPNANRSNFDVGDAREVCKDMPDTTNHLFIRQSVTQAIGLVAGDRCTCTCYHYPVGVTCPSVIPIPFMWRSRPKFLIKNRFNLIILLGF